MRTHYPMARQWVRRVDSYAFHSRILSRHCAYAVRCHCALLSVAFRNAIRALRHCNAGVGV